MSPIAVECNMHTVHACKVPLDLDIVCDKTVKKFQDMKRRKKSTKLQMISTSLQFPCRAMTV